MAEEPPTRRHAPPMCWHLVVAVGERNIAWRHVESLPVPGFLPEGISGDDAPDGGGRWPKLRCSSEKFIRKIFWQWRGVLMVVEGFEAFCDEGGVAGKGLSY